MRKLKKKGSFDVINEGMIAFISFALITLLVILLISVTKQTSIVCSGSYDSGSCYQCNTTYPFYGSGLCFNETAQSATSANGSAPLSTGSAYNGTVQFQEAANLPPQFAQIIVIIVIIVGILGMLTMIGYGAYQKLKD